MKEIFGKDSYILGNSVDLNPIEKLKLKNNNNFTFLYIGNLHSNRWKSLIDISNVLCEINKNERKKTVLHIYSGTFISERRLKTLTKNGCVKFFGQVDSNLVLDIEKEANVLLHVESFQKKDTKSTRLSISTKIFEYLSVGVPILAYGPISIASIEMLKSNNIAIIVENKSELYSEINRILNNYTDLSGLTERSKKFLFDHYNKHKLTRFFENLYNLSCENESYEI